MGRAVSSCDCIRWDPHNTFSHLSWSVELKIKWKLLFESTQKVKTRRTIRLNHVEVKRQRRINNVKGFVGQIVTYLDSLCTEVDFSRWMKRRIFRIPWRNCPVAGTKFKRTPKNMPNYILLQKFVIKDTRMNHQSVRTYWTFKTMYFHTCFTDGGSFAQEQFLRICVSTSEFMTWS